jgi:hypothetical protein
MVLLCLLITIGLGNGVIPQGPSIIKLDGIDQSVTVVVGQSFSVQANHDGANTTGYRLFIDDALVSELPISSLSNGLITFTGVTVATRGSHSIRIVAFNQDVEASSAPFPFSSTLPSPTAPTLIQIIITVAQDGSITLQISPPNIVK